MIKVVLFGNGFHGIPRLFSTLIQTQQQHLTITRTSWRLREFQEFSNSKYTGLVAKLDKPRFGFVYLI